MRKGFDSLCGLVQQHMQLDVLSGGIFIFINKKRNQVKLLLWEGDGLSVYYKRLEKGTYELPHHTNNSRLNESFGQASSLCITAQQLQFILQGVALQKIHFRPRYRKTSLSC